MRGYILYVLNTLSVGYMNMSLLMKQLFLLQRSHLLRIYLFCFRIILSSILTKMFFILTLLICGCLDRTYLVLFKQFEVLFREA